MILCYQVVEDGYEFFAKRQLVTLFSAPNYCGEFDNAGGMMSVDETLLCSFQVGDNFACATTMVGSLTAQGYGGQRRACSLSLVLLNMFSWRSALFDFCLCTSVSYWVLLISCHDLFRTCRYFAHICTSSTKQCSSVIHLVHLVTALFFNFAGDGFMSSIF